MIRLPLLTKYSNLLLFDPSRTEIYAVTDALLILQYNTAYLSIYEIPLKMGTSEKYTVKYFRSIRQILFIPTIEPVILVLHEGGISLIDRRMNARISDDPSCILANFFDTHKDVVRIKDETREGKLCLFVELSDRFAVIRNSLVKEYLKSSFAGRGFLFNWNRSKTSFIDYGLVNGVPVFVVEESGMKGRVLIYKEDRLVGDLSKQVVRIFNNRIFAFAEEQAEEKDCSFSTTIIECEEGFDVIAFGNSKTGGIFSQRVFSCSTSGVTSDTCTVVVDRERNKFLNYEAQSPAIPSEFQVNFPHFTLTCDNKSLFISNPNDCPEMYRSDSAVFDESVDLVHFLKIHSLRKQKERVDAQFKEYFPLLNDKESPGLTDSFCFESLLSNTVAFLLLRDAFPNIFRFSSWEVIPLLSTKSLIGFDPSREIQKYRRGAENVVDSHTVLIDVVENAQNFKFHEVTPKLFYALLIKREYGRVIESFSARGYNHIPDKAKVARLLLNENLCDFAEKAPLAIFVFSQIDSVTADLRIGEFQRLFLSFFRGSYNELDSKVIATPVENVNIPYLVYKDALSRGFDDSAVELLIRFNRNDLATHLLYRQYKKDKKRLKRIRALIGDYVFIDGNKFISREVLDGP